VTGAAGRGDHHEPTFSAGFCENIDAVACSGSASQLGVAGHFTLKPVEPVQPTAWGHLTVPTRQSFPQFCETGFRSHIFELSVHTICDSSPFKLEHLEVSGDLSGDKTDPASVFEPSLKLVCCRAFVLVLFPSADAGAL
jgi:hypothetical protein